MIKIKFSGAGGGGKSGGGVVPQFCKKCGKTKPVTRDGVDICKKCSLKGKR